jgi:hypothetical protein
MRIKVTIFLVVISILFILQVNVLAQQSITSLIKKAQPSIVLITTYNAQGDTVNQGSGFIISQNGEVITNWHVIKNASSIMVKTSTGAIYKVKGIVARDEKRDLAIILPEAKNVSFPHLNLASTLPNIGERIFVIGSPLGLESSVSDGLVSAIREMPDIGKVIQISAPISPGSSGSPIINLKEQVVGVASFQFIKGQNLNFAISSTDVANLLSAKQTSVMPIGNKYMNKINTEVQVQSNSWLKIIDYYIETETRAEFYERVNMDVELTEYDKKEILRWLNVNIQFLKPCQATIKKAATIEEALKEIMNTEYQVPMFRCDYRTKVFITYFNKKGHEIKTEGNFPVALRLNSFSDKRQTIMVPGEKTHVTFRVPNDATDWYVWVPK